MKKTLSALMLLLAVTAPTMSANADVFVNGYVRSDGVYVPPHIRSSPDNTRVNDYGPSTNPAQNFNPYIRDWDNDGTPNFIDFDDDNDGLIDDWDNNQYSW